MEEHKNRTSLIAENSQRVPQVLLSSDPPWNPQSLQGAPVGPATARDTHRPSWRMGHSSTHTEYSQEYK